MHYLLFYEVGADFVARRQQFRALHLEHARRSVARGDLILGGAVGDPVDGALLLFQAEDAEVAAEFARVDPYVVQGLVTRWWVQPWSTVVGADAVIRIE